MSTGWRFQRWNIKHFNSWQQKLVVSSDENVTLRRTWAGSDSMERTIQRGCVFPDCQMIFALMKQKPGPVEYSRQCLPNIKCCAVSHVLPPRQVASELRRTWRHKCRSCRVLRAFDQTCILQPTSSLQPKSGPNNICWDAAVQSAKATTKPGFNQLSSQMLP